MTNFEKLTLAATSRKPRSAWTKGVQLYVLELLDNVKQALADGTREQDDSLSRDLVQRAMLNGASCWDQYSWGGCSLIYDGDIAQRLCTATELKRTDEGRRAPNAREAWLDVQVRALTQAARIIRLSIFEI